jgi:hypothetical protein
LSDISISPSTPCDGPKVCVMSDFFAMFCSRLLRCAAPIAAVAERKRPPGRIGGRFWLRGGLEAATALQTERKFNVVSLMLC